MSFRVDTPPNTRILVVPNDEIGKEFLVVGSDYACNRIAQDYPMLDTNMQALQELRNL